MYYDVISHVIIRRQTVGKPTHDRRVDNEKFSRVVAGGRLADVGPTLEKRRSLGGGGRSACRRRPDVGKASVTW